MPRKYTYREICDIVRSKGFEVLSCEYSGVKDKIDIQDSDGFLYNVELSNLIGGRNPERYRKTNKHSIYNLQHFFILNESKTKVLSKQYVRSSDKLTFQCGECGNIYKTAPNKIISSKNGMVCQECSLRKKGMKHRVPIKDVTNEFVRSGLIPLFDHYSGCDEKLACKDIDGNLLYISYRSLAQRNKSGYSTYRVSYSKYESMVSDYLRELGIEFIPQYVFPDCTNVKPLRFDFAILLPNKKMLLIEVDGEQHFSPVCFGYGGSDANEIYQNVKARDEIKNRYCKERGIDLLRLPYYLFRDEDWKEKISIKIKNLQSAVA